MTTLNSLMSGLQDETLGTSLLGSQLGSQQQDGIELSKVGQSLGIEEAEPSPGMTARDRIRRSRVFGLGVTLTVLLFIVLAVSVVERGPATASVVAAPPPLTNPVASKPVFQKPTPTYQDPPPRANSTFLPSYTLQQVIANPESPQSHALEWVESFPNFRNIYRWRRRQLIALASFFYSTGGTSYWPKAAKKDWLSQKLHECSWQSDELFSPKCPKRGLSGRYTNFKLKPDTLQGTLPPELALLTSLKYLELPSNPNLAGSLPKEWGQLSQLQELNLHNNQLTGTLPSQIGLLTSMTSLHLSDNQFTGEIPSTITELSNLQFLWLHHNRFNGTVSPSVCYFPNLKEIWVDCESVRCPCPQCWCAKKNEEVEGDEDDPPAKQEDKEEDNPWL